MNPRRPLSLLPSLALVFLLPLQSAAQESASLTAFILDTAGKTLTALDVATAKPLSTVSLEGEPTRLLRTKGGARLVVLDRGPGKPRPPYGVRPTGKSAVTVIDTATMKALARFELGWGLGESLLTEDGARLLVVCPGFKSNKPTETLAGEIVTVDMTTAQVASRVGLERPANSVLLARDGRTVLAFSARETGKKPADNVPAELRFFEVGGPPAGPTLKFDGAPGRATLSPDGKFVYLLDVGSPVTKKLKAVDGRLYVVSLESRAIQKTIDAGTDPRGLVVDQDDQQVLILSDGPPSKERNEETGELRVVRGGELVSTVKVATRPSFSRIAPDRDRLHVIGSRSLTTVDYNSFHVLNTQTNDVTIVETEKATVVDKIAGGGNRVQLMTAGGVLAIVGPSLAFIDTTLHKPLPELSLAGSTTMALSPDGRFAVALLARAVACLDGSTGKVLARAEGFRQPVQVVFNMEDRTSKPAP